jgi:putative membrane protein
MLIAFGIFCFVYPFAILLLAFDMMPFGMEWMSNLLLAMLGVTAWAWLWVNSGTVGAILGLFLLVAGLALEYIGVSTGSPFGQYRYTGVFVPDLPGGVPIAIGFAWLSVVVSSLFSVRRYTGVVVAFVAALLAVGLDLLLEPVAFHVKNYWRWLDGDPGYYGVPWSNFAAWFVAAFLMSLVVRQALRSRQPVKWRLLPVTLYVMNVVMFGVVNLTHGFWLAAPIALIILISAWLFQPRHNTLSGAQPLAPSTPPSP